jgi:hypothetical protein
MWDIGSRALNLSNLGLLPKFFGNDVSKVFKQKYYGKLVTACVCVLATIRYSLLFFSHRKLDISAEVHNNAGVWSQSFPKSDSSGYGCVSQTRVQFVMPSTIC